MNNWTSFYRLFIVQASYIHSDHECFLSSKGAYWWNLNWNISGCFFQGTIGGSCPWRPSVHSWRKPSVSGSSWWRTIRITNIVRADGSIRGGHPRRARPSMPIPNLSVRGVTTPNSSSTIDDGSLSQADSMDSIGMELAKSSRTSEEDLFGGNRDSQVTLGNHKTGCRTESRLSSGGQSWKSIDSGKIQPEVGSNFLSPSSSHRIVRHPCEVARGQQYFGAHANGFVSYSRPYDLSQMNLMPSNLPYLHTRSNFSSTTADILQNNRVTDLAGVSTDFASALQQHSNHRRTFNELPSFGSSYSDPGYCLGQRSSSACSDYSFEGGGGTKRGENHDTAQPPNFRDFVFNFDPSNPFYNQFHAQRFKRRQSFLDALELPVEHRFQRPPLTFDFAHNPFATTSQDRHPCAFNSGVQHPNSLLREFALDESVTDVDSCELDQYLLGNGPIKREDGSRTETRFHVE